ncbi:hypothetical protein JW879_08860 [candidate division WOR-3 bacterium]|nr:hypothetical protein [candidate division WOR-3 bacterium]
MNLFILLNLAIPFLTLEVTEKDGEKVRVNVPKTLIEESVEFAKSCDEDWDIDIDGKKIPPDSILKILQEAGIGDEPVIEITEGEDIVRFWVRDSKDIVNKTGTPKRLHINVQSENEEENVNIRLPLTLVKILPFLLPEVGEDAEHIEETKIFIRKAIKQIQKVEGSFTLVEVDDEHEKVKISIE